MISSKFQSLINALRDKTVMNNASWIKTSNPTEFKLRLDVGFITIGYKNNKEGVTIVEMNVFDANGNIVDSLEIASNSQYYNYILDFYSVIQESVGKVDSFFNGLINEIHSKKKIGNSNEE